MGALKRLIDRPWQRNLLLIGLGGVGMMGLSLAQRQNHGTRCA
jgi:hypothetical protein